MARLLRSRVSKLVTLHVSRLASNRFLAPALIFALAALIYSLGARPAHSPRPIAPHYIYLADAFLHGRLDLPAEPPHSHGNDWTYFEGRWYVAFPPLPAILMVPFVAVFGKQFDDTTFTVLFGALNVALIYGLWPRVAPNVTRPAQIGLTILFGFGTVHWWLASFGAVWFTAQIVGVTFLLLALRETFGSGRPIAVGTWLACAALCRPTMIVALPAFVWLLWDRNPPRRLLWALAPLALVGLLMGGYN